MSQSSIRSGRVQTARIDSHVLSCGAVDNEAIVLLHGNLSAATYFEELMLSLSGNYRCIAPDLRGYGATEDLPIDATRGAGDWADDLRALLDTLEIDTAHLLGWSAGAATIMQFAIDRPERTRSLTLVAPVSPYGFGGTCDVEGTPTHADCAGSGAGIVNEEVVAQLKAGNTSGDSPAAPLNLLREFFVKPPLRLEREASLVAATLQQKLGPRRYPGNHERSPNWPYVSPGQWGATNALSPKYYDVSSIADLDKKPPVLWVHGDSDLIVSDSSLFDVAMLVPEGSDIVFPAQPMVGQMRQVLSSYASNGGQVREVEFGDTGHSPFLEKPEAFTELLSDFLAQERSPRERHG
ncbi:MAG: alpha/beta hydrolase [Pseudomonadota bacterium]